jgi:hypothetical protein
MQLLLPVLASGVEWLVEGLTSSPSVAAIAMCCLSMVQVSSAGLSCWLWAEGACCQTTCSVHGLRAPAARQHEPAGIRTHRSPLVRPLWIVDTGLLLLKWPPAALACMQASVLGAVALLLGVLTLLLPAG